MGDFKQIVYIVVSTSPNDNFNALYISIGKAIDNALGLVDPIYEKMLSKRCTLGEKTLIIENIIEKFNLGMILIDEIQLMSFTTNKENSYTSLAKLSNDTKVSIATIGLSEATKQMFQQEWTSRRLGSTIQADLYCENYDYFKYNLSKLLNYNWIKNPIETTEEGIQTLFKLTNGTIAYLISFYMRVQLSNYDNDKSIVLTDKYIEEVMNKYFSGLTNILLNKSTKKTLLSDEIKRQNAITETNNQIALELDKKLQEAEMQRQIINDKVNENNKAYSEQLAFISKVVKIFDSSKADKDIAACYEQVFKLFEKSNRELSNDDALALTLEKLKQPKRRLKKKENNNSQQVGNFVSKD